ncbi:MAG: DUF6173 family protein [Paracoccaceae bacterium]
MNEQPTPPATTETLPLSDEEKRMRAMAQAANVQAGRYDAEILFNHLRREMAEFQEKLDETHEIGLRLANFGTSSQVHIRGISFENPNMIEFIGMLDGNQPVKVVQHINQLNLLMVAVPPVKDAAPYRVGF